MKLIQRRNRSDLSLLVWISAVCLPVLLTLPDPRYFLPAFPALAIAGARGLHRRPDVMGRALVLALAYCGRVLYLAGDWYQMRRLFLR